MNLSPLPIQKFFDNSGRPLNGGQLFTYIAGTSTKLATYLNQGGTPNANPIVLDFRGEANVWLDQTLTYKFVLAPEGDTDPPTRPIWSVDNISAGITFASLTQMIIGRLLYPMTAAEITAGVTIVNWYYPPLYVDRYGTNTTPGTTSMRAAFQAAIDTAKQGAGTIKYGATTPYLVDASLNLTNLVGGTTLSFTILGEGNPAAITANPPYRPTIIFKHTGHGFDCTGTLGVFFENVSVTTDSVTYPQTCWLLARNTDGRSQLVKFRNCRVLGNFSDAVVYNYGSENDQYNDCQFYNFAGTSGSCVMRFTATNVHSLTSTFTTIYSGPISTIDHRVIGGEYMNFSAQADADVMWLDGIAGLKIYGAWMLASNGVGKGRALIYVFTATSPSNLCVLNGITGENPGPGLCQDYGVRFGGEGAQTCGPWSIRDSTLPNSTAMISAAAVVVCDSFQINGCSNQTTGGGIVIAGTLQNSVIDEYSNNISIGTSTNNRIGATSANLTVTTRSGDFWECPAETWTPNTSALTITGALTVSSKRLQHHGSQCTFNLQLAAATSIVCAAGTAITGLPRASVVNSADVIVYNASTNALIGTGSVNGANILMPVINVGAGVPIIITGRYFES